MSERSSFEERYLSGRELWGDDFGADDLAAWFADEREAYADLVHGEPTTDYFRGINQMHGFRHLPGGRFARVLGVGSGTGEELLPIVERIDSATLLEPSQQLRRSAVGALRPAYVEPQASGTMPFESGVFDLVVCLGVLHHIANVTHVVHELARVTRSGGYVLVREPTTSMGDWRRPRRWTTMRERGIPIAILRRTLASAGFEVVREAPCLFPTTSRLISISPRLGPQGASGALLDALLSRAFARNHCYHATRRRQKLRPTAAFFVLRRRERQGAADG